MSTVRTNAILDAAGGNTATINGITPALSSQAQAQTGTDNTTLMTPLRVAQAARPQTATAVASTSGTAIDFTNIPAWAKQVTVMFNGVSTTGTSGKIIQIGSTTFDVTGYLGSESNVTTAVGSANVTNGFGIRSVAAADVIHGSVTLSNITGNTWTASGVLALSNAASTLLVAGSRALAGVLDRVRITTAGGTDTFDAGSINVMWE